MNKKANIKRFSGSNRRIVEPQVVEPTTEQKINLLGRVLNHIVMNKMQSVISVLCGIPNAPVELAKASSHLICSYVRAVIEFSKIRSYESELATTWGDLESTCREWLRIGILRGEFTKIPVRFHGNRNQKVKIDMFVLYLVLDHLTGQWLYPKEEDDLDIINVPIELSLNADSSVITVRSGIPFSPGPFISSILVDHRSKRRTQIRIETIQVGE